MTIRYHTRRGESLPEYSCQAEGIKRAEPPCQRILGADIDRAIGELLVETMSPLALEVALCVQDELAARASETDRLRRQHVERARYDSELAQRRYLRVDPDNRLVAATLEAEWNNKLRALTAAQQDYERQREADTLLDEEKRQNILKLATDFPRLWHDPHTPVRERKRMARLLIDDVTLTKDDDLVVNVRFRGGPTRTLRLARPKPAVDLHKLDPAVVAEVDRLLDNHTDSEIADALNAAGWQPPVGEKFTTWIVWKIRKAQRLESRFDRLRRQGMLTESEMANTLGVHPYTVKARQARGELTSVAYNDKNQRLYYPPAGEPAMTKCAHCAKPIPERGPQGQHQKYCCVSCRTGAYAVRRRAAGWVRPPRKRT
jgi:hypothetical protein